MKFASPQACKSAFLERTCRQTWTHTHTHTFHRHFSIKEMRIYTLVNITIHACTQTRTHALWKSHCDAFNCLLCRLNASPPLIRIWYVTEGSNVIQAVREHLSAHTAATAANAGKTNWLSSCLRMLFTPHVCVQPLHVCACVQRTASYGVRDEENPPKLRY